MATMIVHWIQPLLLICIAMQCIQCCYHRDIINETDSGKLMVQPGDPPRSIGWEQMILMFKGPRRRNSTREEYNDEELKHSITVRILYNGKL